VQLKEGRARGDEIATQDEPLLTEDRVNEGQRRAAANENVAGREGVETIDFEAQEVVEEGLRGIGRELRDYVDQRFGEKAAEAESVVLGETGSLERASVRGAVFGALVLALGVWLGSRRT
jgi:hypothetical protein